MASDRLLSAAACAEIAARLAGTPSANPADDARYFRAYVPALLRTVNALREALEPFAKQRKHSGFSGPTYRIMRVDWERAVTVYDSTAAGQNQTSDTASVQEIEDAR